VSEHLHLRRWGDSDRFVPTKVVQPIQRLLAQETAGGVVMLVAAIAALIWANSPVHESYFRLWETPFDLRIGTSGPFHLELTLQEAVNDILMTFFFYLAALEIKHELVHGDFRDRRAAALPALAALGGMVVPALVYVMFNAGGDAVGGWGIPMATDIAFAVSVVTLLGRRVPLAARAFLLTLAVADDIGGIVVIALFYTDDLSLGWLALAAAALVGVYAAQRVQIRSYAPYLLLGVTAWFCLHESGVHATIAGVLLGLLTPANPFYRPRDFAGSARPLVERVSESFSDNVVTSEESNANETGLRDLVRLSVETMSPLERHLAWAGPWVAFVIVPIFALANAGVRFVGGDLGNPLTDPVVMGPALGLLIGKTVGITLASFAAVKSGVGKLPEGVGWPMIVGLATTAGVGFTVALFITSLSFDDPDLTDRAKIGVLAGSIVSGVAGYLMLRAASTRNASAHAPEGRVTAGTAAGG
jgi:NhaA family Na+:H+ antiporter